LNLKQFARNPFAELPTEHLAGATFTSRVPSRPACPLPGPLLRWPGLFIPASRKQPAFWQKTMLGGCLRRLRREKLGMAKFAILFSKKGVAFGV